MSPNSNSMAEENRRGKWFVTTRCSVVFGARGHGGPKTKAALNSLCTSYWYPLYAFARRVGYSPHDAEDLVQSFFAECLAKEYLAAADPEKGKFRSFMLIAFKRFVSKAKAQSITKKRGGGEVIISIDSVSAEQRYAMEPVDKMSPEKLYERRWALTLLENALARIKTEHRSNPDLFEDLLPFLNSTKRDTPYADIALRHQTSEAAIKVMVHRLRKRYRELLEEEIANTISCPEDIEEEKRYLFRVMTS